MITAERHTDYGFWALNSLCAQLSHCYPRPPGVPVSDQSAAASPAAIPAQIHRANHGRYPGGLGEHRHDVFDSALTGSPVRLITHDGRELPTAATRWYAPANHDDQWLLRRCTGPTVDLGCGPGRLVAELTARAIPALGIDCSPHAVRECRHRGGAALRRDLFDVLPDEGRWHHALLADGNIGIGGNPHTLLRRCATLIRPGGTLLIETVPPTNTIDIDTMDIADIHTATDLNATGSCWQGNARLHHPANQTPPSAWFAWAVIDTDALIALAEQLQLITTDVHHGTRSFVELQRRPTTVSPNHLTAGAAAAR